jgi:hypothetical protein
MSRTQIKIVGAVRNSDSEGLQFSIALDGWREALSGTDNWPGLGQRPSEHRACAAYDQALHSDPEYKRATAKFIEEQHREPRFLSQTTDLLFEDSDNLLLFWAYHGKVLSTVIDKTDPDLYEVKPTGGRLIYDAILLLIKHHVLRREKVLRAGTPRGGSA